MKISLIILTYNRPDALEAVLKSILNQVIQPDEVIIADDGSGPETRELVYRYKALCPFSLKHVWHEDLGYRIAAIRNKATLKSTGDYLIFSDGDLLLHPRFIKDFQKQAKTKTAWIGSRVFLTPETSHRVICGRTNRQVWSFLSGEIAANRLNSVRLSFISALFPAVHHTGKMRGGLLGVWKEDLLAVNGWNEEFTGWGMEDSELVSRLYFSGVTIRKLKFAGITYHLWHPVADRKFLDKNREILDQTLRNQESWCKNGLFTGENSVGHQGSAKEKGNKRR